jgi:hypothetical protein
MNKKLVGAFFGGLLSLSLFIKGMESTSINVEKNINTLPQEIQLYIISFLVNTDTLENSIKSLTKLKIVGKTSKLFHDLVEELTKDLTIQALATKFNLTTRQVAITAIKTLKLKGKKANLLKKLCFNESINDELIYATKKGDLQQVLSLLQQGANPNAQASFSIHRKPKKGHFLTPLAWASRYGYTDIVKALINAGASVNAQEPILHAAEIGYGDIVQILINAGACVNVEKLSQDMTALDYAHRNGDLQMALLLVLAGAKRSDRCILS